MHGPRAFRYLLLCCRDILLPREDCDGLSSYLGEAEPHKRRQKCRADGLRCVQVSLRDVISSTVEMVAADATKKGLDLAYTMDDALLRRTVLGDAIRIRQVLLFIRLQRP